jgi:crotonobetainyl-CoA:carnitine CoA-transferase CaiB-like acyl-CoA transferase
MLRGCKVLDLTTERGFLCGQILGDLGGEVIKVEPPGGSPARRLAPFFNDTAHPDRSIYWSAYNRNKRGITLNLATEKGLAIFHRLAKDAHFLIESNPPGESAKVGISYRDLSAYNPSLVYVSITPFGQDGPKAGYADSDLIIMAAGGPLILYGDEDRPPIRMSVPQAYLHASVDAAAAALIAYYEQLDSGLGQHLDIAAQESVSLAAQSTTLATPLRANEMRRMAGGIRMGPIRVPLVWPAKDGQISCVFLFGTAFGPFTQKLMSYIYQNGGCDQATRDKDWLSYADLLLSGKEPMEEYERVKSVVSRFFSDKTKAELFDIARENTLLIAPVATIDEVLDNPQFKEREYWQPVEHPELGRPVHYPGPFARFGAHPIAYRRRPPRIGEHNREVYVGELGLSERQLAELERFGVV